MSKQLTLDNDSFIVLKKRQKIAWAKPPASNPDKITFYRAIYGDVSPIYDLIEQVAPEVSAMYPEMNGLVLGVRVKAMSWCCACWDYFKDEIDFDSGTPWTLKDIGSTLAHELTHAYHSKFKSIPSGEKATDVFMLSKVPLKYLTPTSYLECAKDVFELVPEGVQAIAKEAIAHRNSGMRQYIRWFEGQINQIHYEFMPKQNRVHLAACKKNPHFNYFSSEI